MRPAIAEISPLMPLQSRPISSGSLQYILICQRESISPVRLPAALRAGAMQIAQIGPKSLGQLLNPLGWHRSQLAHGLFQPVQFHVCYADTLDAVLPAFATDQALSVFLLHKPSAATRAAITRFPGPALVTALREKNGQPQQFQPGCRSSGEFSNEDEFWEALYAVAPAVLGEAAAGLATGIATAREEFTRIRARIGYDAYPDFRACRNLHRVICSLLSPASYWEIPTKKITHTQRPEAVQDLLEHCFKVHLVASDFEAGRKKFTGTLPPLLWVMPSHDPWMRKRLLRRTLAPADGFELLARQLIAASFLEQSLVDYNLHSEISEDTRPLVAGLHLLSERVAFLDNLAGLHSSFRESPCLRSPLQGSSLAQSLSAFNPKIFRQVRDYRKVRAQIGRAGQALGRLVSSRLANVIPVPISTVVAISDLPVEWLAIEDEPLAFLTDLCRLPESPPTSLLAQFARNSLFECVIDEATIKKTLVVCGAERTDPIYHCFEIARDLISARNLPVTFVHCDTREAFFAAITSARPELLIVDCHGDFQDNETGSVLRIGADTITGHDIVAHQATAPLVVLSCCWGAPIYGCANTIAQAFFEMGAMSVLTTMLPVDPRQAVKLYIRLLNNLAEAAKIPVHENWASFISHLLRTSLFDDCLERLPPDLRILGYSPEATSGRRAHWQAATMDPGQRRGMFKGIAQAVASTFPAEHQPRVRQILERDDFIPECLFYCHLGRGDLIGFDSWRQDRHLQSDPPPAAAPVPISPQMPMQQRKVTSRVQVTSYALFQESALNGRATLDIAVTRATEPRVHSKDPFPPFGIDGTTSSLLDKATPKGHLPHHPAKQFEVHYPDRPAFACPVINH